MFNLLLFVLRNSQTVFGKHNHHGYNDTHISSAIDVCYYNFK